MSKFKQDVKYEGTKLVVSVSADPNEDGQPVAELDLKIDLLEVPDEVMDLIIKKKAEKAG